MASRIRMNLAQCVDRIWYRPGRGGWLLAPLGAPWRFIAAVRRRLYRWGWRRVVTPPAPVVVIGNLTVGGTGKTPLVAWMARQLRERGLRVGIVSRGYAGRARTWPQAVDRDDDPARVGDEAVLLARATDCPVSVGPDRVAAARALLEREAVDVLLADDGLQHFALGRTMEIVVVDGERGLGNGHCLPAGPLREPRGRIARAGAVVVNGGAWAPRTAGDSGAVFRAAVRALPVCRLADGERRPLNAFRGRRVHAVAAIGHPARFFRMLESAGVRVVAHPLPDHAPIAAADLCFNDSWPVLVTEKDAVKCRRIAHRGVWCVPIGLSFEPRAAAELIARVLAHIEARRWISP